MFFTCLAMLQCWITNISLILFIIITVLLGGILPLIERKFLSLIQRRVGPDVVGYRGRLQFIADAVKLFLKEVIIIKRVNVWQFSLLPMSYFILNIPVLTLLTWGREGSALVPLEYSVPLLMVFFNICNLIIIFTGLNLKNRYTTLSGRRASMMAVNFDIVITAVLIILVGMYNHFSFLQPAHVYKELIPVTTLPPLVILVLLMFLMDVGRAPFDLVEAESELIMGFHSEYSSFLFALYILGEYVHIFIFSYLSVTLLVAPHGH